MDPVLALVIIVALICVTVVTVVLTKSQGAVISVKLGKRNLAGPQGGQPEPGEVQPPAPALQEITFKQALESDALATGLEELSKRQVEYALGLNSESAVVQAVTLAEER